MIQSTPTRYHRNQIWKPDQTRFSNLPQRSLVKKMLATAAPRIEVLARVFTNLDLPAQVTDACDIVARLDGCQLIWVFNGDDSFLLQAETLRWECDEIAVLPPVYLDDLAEDGLRRLEKLGRHFPENPNKSYYLINSARPGARGSITQVSYYEALGRTSLYVNVQRPFLERV